MLYYGAMAKQCGFFWPIPVCALVYLYTNRGYAKEIRIYSHRITLFSSQTNHSSRHEAYEPNTHTNTNDEGIL